MKDSNQYQSFFFQSKVALIEQDLDAAFDYYYKAVEAAEPGAITRIQGYQGERSVFPEFFADPRYAQMLEDFKVDPDSVAKMEIQPLPF